MSGTTSNVWIGTVVLASAAVLASPLSIPVRITVPSSLVSLTVVVAAGFGVVKLVRGIRRKRRDRAVTAALVDSLLERSVDERRAHRIDPRPTRHDSGTHRQSGGEARRPRNLRSETDLARPVGRDYDAAFEALGADSDIDADVEGFREALREAVEIELVARGRTPDEARRLVAEGEWTDDRRAAAFLGDATLPLRTRLRDWASGEGRRRSAVAAVEELAALTEEVSA